MFSFFKHKNDNPDVPEWASFFDGKEYTEFLRSIETYFGEMNLSYQMDDGVLAVGPNDFGFTNLGLSNVAQVCKQNKRSAYREIVSEHFDSLVRAQKFDIEFKKSVDDFDKVGQYLAVRLYANEYVDHIGKENTIGKPFAGDVYSMLVFDLPDSIVNVRPEQTEKWNRNAAALFEIGLQNIRQKYAFDISTQNFNGFNIWFVTGDHFFIPNILFDFHIHPEMVGTHGALIGIPHRHTAIIYPIESVEVLKTINQLIPAIYGMNLEGPGSLSNNLFWFKDGNFETQPYKLENNQFQFFPTSNFTQMLNSLRG